MLIVVLPAYNEVQALPRLLARFREVASRLPQPFRILVVDDGSSDGTAAAAQAADSPEAPVQLIRHDRNRGLCAALDTGFRAAVQQATAEDDLLVTMDSDDTHPPDLILKMLEARAAGAELVIASRFRPGAEWHGKSWDRVLFSYTVSTLFRTIYPIRGVRDYTCGYRLCTARLMRQGYDRWGDTLFDKDTSFAGVLDLLLKLMQFRPRVAEVPLALHYDRKPTPSKMQVVR